ncbi:MAG: NADH-quinone oxidoreductase subunit K, partial [bacterium]
MAVGLAHYLFVSAVLFSLGVVGVMVRRNAIIIFM